MATILLVEDDQLLADCLAQWLQAENHTVIQAADAQSAVDCLDNTLPDAILLDIFLPGANGVQILHTLRSYAEFAEIPVIICSNAIAQFEPVLSAYGVRKVIDKTTLTRDVLATTIKEALDARSV